jgi:hypothetical protein
MMARDNDVTGDTRKAPAAPDVRDGDGAMSPLILQLVLSFGGEDGDRSDPRTWPSLSRKAQRAIARRA